jgi:hypothetical protein
MMVFECRKTDGGKLCMNESDGVCFFGASCKHRVKTDDMRLYKEMTAHHKSQNL